jgi:sec-independent protein translocase protein TatC
MRHYRRHAIVVVLLTMAILTPSTDMLTLLVASLPICLLYEGSIWAVRAVEGKQPASLSSEIEEQTINHT